MARKWAMFTRRTEEPKLCWLETALDTAGIPNRRRGSSWHAPILEVPENRLDAAWKILTPRIDNLRDDSPRFRMACYERQQRRGR